LCIAAELASCIEVQCNSATSTCILHNILGTTEQDYSDGEYSQLLLVLNYLFNSLPIGDIQIVLLDRFIFK